MNISNYNKADVLAALYNASKPQGMGMLHFNPSKMTQEQAQEMLDSGQTYFDYVQGRVMKIDLSGDELDSYLYDRDLGQGACQRVIDSLSPVYSDSV